MKKIFVLMILVSTLVISCGKDDKKTNNVVNTNPIGYVPPGSGPGGQPIPPGQNYPGNYGSYNFQYFSQLISTGQFNIPYPQNIEYLYYEVITDLNQSDWWIFDFYSYSTQHSDFVRRRYASGIFEHEFCPQGGTSVTVVCDLNYLVSRFMTLFSGPSVQQYYPINQYRFMVTILEGQDLVAYEFDLSKDIVANPISRQVVQGPTVNSGYYLYTAFPF